jgi:chaperone BCS1
MAAFAVHPSDYPMGINAPLLPTDPRAGVMPLSGDPALDEFFKGLSTGILLLDAVLCITIPLVLQVIVSALFRSSGGALTKLRKWLGLSKNLENIVLRTIEITQRFNDYGNKIWDYEQKNHLLQKAISLYLTKTLNLTDKDGKYDLFEKPLNRAGKALNGHEDGDDATDTSELSCTDDGSESDYDYGYSVSVDKLSVKAMPQHNTWIEVEKGVEFMHEVQENDGEKKGPRESKVIFNFRSTLPDASDRIDAIINRAYIEYREMERQKHITDKTRYFYIQSGTKSGSGDENASRIVAYKRYALGEEKTFDNLFFQDKRQVLQLLDSFTSKSGKFAIKGFPYKLGLLLHGPPGTGKTSLIKAIAQHTKRHIVTISLGKIKTNQELLDSRTWCS